MEIWIRNSVASVIATEDCRVIVTKEYANLLVATVTMTQATEFQADVEFWSMSKKIEGQKKSFPMMVVQLESRFAMLLQCCVVMTITLARSRSVVSVCLYVIKQ